MYVYKGITLSCSYSKDFIISPQTQYFLLSLSIVTEEQLFWYIC